MTGTWPIDSNPSDMSRRLGFFKNLQRVANKIHATRDSDEVLLEMSEDICELFHCDRLTIYALASDRQSILAKIKTGLASHQTIRLPISHDSLAGYVAATGRILNIRDVYDERELAGHSGQLRFLREVDQRTGYRTKQMLVAPILDPSDGGLLGVVQLINNRSDAPFPMVAEEGIQALTQTLAVALVRHQKLTPPEPSPSWPSPVRFEGVSPGTPTAMNLAASDLAGEDEDERPLLEMLVAAYRQEVSHIHVEPGIGGESTCVRFRRHGDLSTYTELPSRRGAAWIRHLKRMADLDLFERWRPQEGWIPSTRWGFLPIDLRVVTVPTVVGIEDTVLHLMPNRERIPLEGLGLDLPDLERLQGLIAQAHGLVLLCGPPDCGKTTVQHAILAHLNRPEKKIWVAEDAEQTALKGVRQMATRLGGPINVAAMRHALLSADADVIALGELRDQGSVALAVDAALAGHLVLARLRAVSVPQALRYLLARGTDRHILGEILLGVLARRRVQRLCSACREAYEPTAEERRALFVRYDAVYSSETAQYADPDLIEALARRQSSRYAEGQSLTLYRACGCPACGGRGYDGYVALHELLPTSDWLKQLLLKPFSDDAFLAAALKEDRSTLDTDGIDRLLSGATDLQSIRVMTAF